VHELSIIKSVMKAVFSEMKRENLTRLTWLKIRVGELTAADEGALRFAFNEELRGTPSEGAALDIIQAHVTAKCASCKKTFRAKGFHAKCPACGTEQPRLEGGHEIELISMDALP
jgi:hydrogenase nickel incorporation protein HypA/HybF